MSHLRKRLRTLLEIVLLKLFGLRERPKASRYYCTQVTDVNTVRVMIHNGIVKTLRDIWVTVADN